MSEEKSDLKGLGISFVIIVLVMVGIPYGVTFLFPTQDVWRGPPPKRPRHILKLVSRWLHARMLACIITPRQLQKSHCRTCFAAVQHNHGVTFQLLPVYTSKLITPAISSQSAGDFSRLCTCFNKTELCLRILEVFPSMLGLNYPVSPPRVLGGHLAK